MDTDRNRASSRRENTRSVNERNQPTDGLIKDTNKIDRSNAFQHGSESAEQKGRSQVTPSLFL